MHIFRGASPRRNGSSTAAVRMAVGFAMALLVCSGCSRSNTQTLTGTVTLDGQPLGDGQIEFDPAPETGGPIVGATIDAGAYEVPEVAQGLRLNGTYVVRITSMQGKGLMVLDPNSPGRKREALENVIPARYNLTSELSVTIEPGETVRDFALESGGSQPTAMAP